MEASSFFRTGSTLAEIPGVELLVDQRVGCIDDSVKLGPVFESDVVGEGVILWPDGLMTKQETMGVSSSRVSGDAKSPAGW